MDNFETYWDNFLIRKSGQPSYYDGTVFEDLVEELLAVMFGKKWKSTPKTHDGNKDFFLFTETEKLWAECKNYREPIAMKTLAPTLVMAQVCDADVILFFSRSYINKSAKNKICSYGKKTNKKIIFYDAKLLEQLIVLHNDKLSSKFQLPSNSCNCDIDLKGTMEIAEFFFPSTFSSMITTEENYKDYVYAKMIHYNEPFSLLLTLCNNSLQKKEVEIWFAAEDNDDRIFYEYLNKNISRNNRFITKQILEAGESKAILINLRISVFKPFLSLPRFEIRYMNYEHKMSEWSSQNVLVKCTWVGSTKLLGEHYNKIVNQVEERLVENTAFSTFLISGSSGTGKSRILKECHCPLLKYGYRILELNVSKEHITSSLLKEIIYFLYEVPAELIVQVLETRLSGEQYEEIVTNMGIANKIAQMIMSLDETSLDNFINKYSELLFEKMAQDRIAIIIDNMQFSSDYFQEFWRRYIVYATNQCRENKSILFVTVNFDYMTAETSKTIYTIKNSNVPYLIDETVTGFSTINQGIMFLRELIHIKTDEYDSLFSEIIEAVSLNPFNLHQMIKLMEETDVIRNLPNKQGYIFSTEALWKTTWKIPKDINDVLERRLLFIEQELGVEETYNILSACYLLEVIDEKKAELLNISTNSLNYLYKHQILTCDRIGYSFVHDIIRKFFEDHCREKRLWCLKKIHVPDSQSIQYNALHNVVQICVMRNVEYIIKFCEKRSFENIPIRIRSLILENLFDECIVSKSAFSDVVSWLGSLMWLCKCSRDFMGSFEALDYYNRVYNYLDNMFSSFSDICCNELRHLLHSHCDILIQTHQRSNAIDFAKKIINKLTRVPIKNTNQNALRHQEYIDEYFVLKAIMYNRIFCAYNNTFPTIEVKSKRNVAIVESRKLIPMIKNEHKRNLVSYMNDSDEGYQFYGFASDYNKLMHIWSRCTVNIPDIAPEKTMNYYRKCVQCSLITQDEEQTNRNISAGINYLNNGTYSHEPLIFNTFFDMAEVMCYLQHHPYEMCHYIEKLLDKLVKTQLILKNNKMGDICMLRGINAFYANDIHTVYYALKEAFQIYNEKKGTNYWFKRELVKENIITAYSALKINDKCYDISFLPVECINELSHTRKDDFQAKGIIRTCDFLFNLPLVV